MLDNREMRAVYCDSLVSLAKTNPDIVVFEADLMKANGTAKFFKEFPERAFDVGVAEANMIGVAAGMSTFGKIPFCATFGTFATRRCFDQIFISAAYSKRNVKIIGSDPGISAELNGGTHMPFEDMGIMRIIPDVVCVEPTDEAMLEALMPQIAAHYGVVYMRLFRKKSEKIYEKGEKFDLFKAKKIKDGKDVSIICSGIMVERAITAAKILAEKEIDAEIINTFTWKPLDEEAVLSSVKKCGAVVTAENHSVINGLGSAVCELISEKYPVPAERVGVKDLFGEVGKISYLEERFSLRATDIAAAAERAYKRKTK